MRRIFSFSVSSVFAGDTYINPLLAIVGYRVYTIVTVKGRKYVALAQGDDLLDGDNIVARRALDRLLLVETNRSAIARSAIS